MAGFIHTLCALKASGPSYCSRREWEKTRRRAASRRDDNGIGGLCVTLNLPIAFSIWAEAGTDDAGGTFALSPSEK